MQLNRAFPGTLLIVTLLALPFVVGSSCIVIFGSGGGSSNNDKKNNNNQDVVVVTSGSFSAPATAGLNFESGATTGVTGAGGEFQFEAGQPVQFSIGDVKLGNAVPGKTVMTPEDLVGGSANADTAAINMSRLLQSLDADPADDVVSIPAAARAAAVRSNETVSAAIDAMDFSDETRFVNAASQLVATLTESYPFTAALVDAGSVKALKTSTENNATAQ